MIIRPRMNLLLPSLALGTSLLIAGGVQAQERHDQSSSRTSASLRISFGSTPHWVGVRGTRVEEITQAERPNYDMFRYGGSYYVYNNNQWYSSPNESGDFDVIDSHAVPGELSSVPREHWRNYPAGWQNRGNEGPNDVSGNLEVTFGNRPRWADVRGTRVRMIRRSDRPNYDMFRYGRNYYVYSNDRWYMSRRPDGQFAMIDDRYVPRELGRVPRGEWRSYPSRWQGQSSNNRYRDGR